VTSKQRDDVLTRSRLRDVVIVFSVVSALFIGANSVEIGVGMLFLLFGTFIHVVTKGVLIRNEVLCQDGIYSVVRHPYYLANYMVDTSFCLFSGNPYLLLVYPFLFFWSYGPTLRNEEGVLSERHGEVSVAFILSTPPIFPDRQSVRNISALFAGFSRHRVSSKEIARILRFCSMGSLILACGRIGGAGVLVGRACLRADPRMILLIVTAAILYGLSLLFLSLRRKSG